MNHPNLPKKRFVILISGRGSNMRAIVEKNRDNQQVEIAAVISHTPDSQGLQWAKEQGIETEEVLHKHYANREAFEQELIQVIDRYQPDYIVLAGFMRILTAGFVTHYASRVINIHPSLLPSFIGLHTHQQALDMGVKVHGCTIHVVTPELDHGPIIAQAVVPVCDDDTADTLASRVLKMEHTLYPNVVKGLAEGRIVIKDDKVQNPQGLLWFQEN
ncbi:phosphoribosylglycinamide formyltransferase [Basilea psittacipulmonis]|uniref:Phosphoribosylglycinamide formyltransferase n=1 Tax=Basilea psittacipulmonis DSM 24701 TaxID=1072685 RepID=A0A077DC79_9BURK|nr:phosphoribosylglycinamide formyltransferase [Basilea psittacipulmonis]AIL32495.1 phosphoribosylglycinamide formyltransferase [Basilea psittacipulmonis DSM 24701]